MTWLLIGGGLVGLVVAAHYLVDGAARLGLRLGIPAIVIGLTMVAFGTSAPELAVSLRAGLSDSADIAVGNIVGSNIFNVLLILGLSALVLPLAVHRHLMQRDVPLMIAVSLLVWWMASDLRLSTVDGAVLAAILVTYLGWLYYGVRSGRADVELDPEAMEAAEKPPRALWIDLLSLVGGIIGLVIAADWLVQGAVQLARALGVSELVIGLTIVSLGTSLPELATSVVAAIKGERDIAVGNIVGSNLFNLLSVLGITALVAPGGLAISAQAVQLDMPVMVAVSLLCVPMFLIGYELSRLDGAMMLALLTTYIVVLILLARGQVFASQDVWTLCGAVGCRHRAGAIDHGVVTASPEWSGLKHGAADGQQAQPPSVRPFPCAGGRDGLDLGPGRVDRGERCAEHRPTAGKPPAAGWAADCSDRARRTRLPRRRSAARGCLGTLCHGLSPR